MTRRSFLTALAAVCVARPKQRSGSLGRGRWFGSFGAGMSATLHGTEAVVTAEQAPAFTGIVIDELHEHPNRIILHGSEMRRWMEHQISLSRRPA